MSEHDRGAYAPPTADAPLSFDARHPVRGARPFPVTLILSGLVLLGLIAAIFLFYRSGVREAGQPPKTIGAPVAEMKSAAPADAQPQDPAAGLQIYQSEQGSNAPAAGQPNFVPPPEEPAVRPASPTAAAAPPPPAAAPTTPVTTSATLRPALPPASLPPAPKPQPKVAAAPPPPVAAKPPVAKPVPPKPVAARPAVPAPAAVAKGGTVVQIGAVSSTALADKAWTDAVHAVPGLAAGKGKGVEKIEKDGHVLYRTAVTGFASKTDAAAFCAKLKASGKACFVK